MNNCKACDDHLQSCVWEYFNYSTTKNMLSARPAQKWAGLAMLKSPKCSKPENRKVKSRKPVLKCTIKV